MTPLDHHSQPCNSFPTDHTITYHPRLNIISVMLVALTIIATLAAFIVLPYLGIAATPLLITKIVATTTCMMGVSYLGISFLFPSPKKNMQEHCANKGQRNLTQMFSDYMRYVKSDPQGELLRAIFTNPVELVTVARKYQSIDCAKRLLNLAETHTNDNWSKKYCDEAICPGVHRDYE